MVEFLNKKRVDRPDKCFTRSAVPYSIDEIPQETLDYIAGQNQ
jgi:hypothetical protein